MVNPSVALMTGLAAFALCLGSCANRSAKGPTGNKADAALAAAIPYNDILTQHGDIYRTGANLHESSLTPASVRSGLFGRLFDWRGGAPIYTQPLYVSNLLYRGRLINMVVIATTNNNVYTFEAPAAGSSLPPSRSPPWEGHNSVLGNPLCY